MNTGGNPSSLSRGRPKGSKNKATQEMKEIVREAFEKAGGADYLVKVSKESPRAFCALIGKLIPSDVNANITATVALPDYLAEYWRRRTDR